MNSTTFSVLMGKVTMPDSPKKELFCTSQGLSLLRVRKNVRRYLSGGRFWQMRHQELKGDRKTKSPWKEIQRDKLVQELTEKGRIKRLAVVCSAGLGKSTNLEWLEFKLAAPGSRQVPFLLALDEDEELPEDLDEFWNTTLPDRIPGVQGKGEKARQQIMAALGRYRTQGRITLLLDSIDQATPKGWKLVRALLKPGDWDHCPIVISARPHAVFERWNKLIGPHQEAKWHFVHIEPLEVEQRKLLLNQDGIDRYGQLPPRGQTLMANPRNIEYVRKMRVKPCKRKGKVREPKEIINYTLRDLRTASHVFAGAVDYMVRLGMKAREARYLDNPKDKPPPERPSPRMIEFAHDLLAALAFSMYCFPISTKQAGPNVSHIPTGLIPEFHQYVRDRLVAAGCKDSKYTVQDLEKDIDALAALNSKIKYDLLDTDASQYKAFRWYDRSLQEFYAARWLARFANNEALEPLRQWRYNDCRDRANKALYEPLWGYLVEMPLGVRKDEEWASAVGVLFEPGAPRWCEMIYRSWPAMARSRAGSIILARWREEFLGILEAPGIAGDEAREIRDGFRRCPKDPYADEKPFLMGSPENEETRERDEFQHSVVVPPFAMHKFPVTNAQYELFDPGHKKERRDGPHPAGKKAGNHPVVNVSWFEAWCFARWTGNHLPTEAQWEYACRGGTPYQVFHFGDTISSLQGNFDGNYPYGKIDEADPRIYLNSTSSVGSYRENGFGLYDMHGNVLEWCRDWYDRDFYHKKRGQQRNPLNKKTARARVFRGGSWGSLGVDCRSATRRKIEPDVQDPFIGFRLAAVL